MKRGIIFCLLVVLSVFVSTQIVSAISGMSQFGGRIIFPKAMEIQALEALGYNCFVPGSTISIVPIGSPSGTPTSYFIPYYTRSKTGTIPTAGQLILGKYGITKTLITCVLSYFPFTVTPVYLDTINLFGTSRL